MKKTIAAVIVFAMMFVFFSSCSSAEKFETTVTTAVGPADIALPRQMVFAAGRNSDGRLIEAAKIFCDRANSFSEGGVMFSFVLSDNVFRDMNAGAADIILLENSSIEMFSPMTEPFRYKSYEHFSMSANSAATLKKLSEYSGANVIAGFYTGSNVFLSDGRLDTLFKSAQNSGDDEDGQSSPEITVTTISESTARAFSLPGITTGTASPVDSRISGFAAGDGAVEFMCSELNSPALLRAIVQKTARESDASENGRIYMTRAFTEINPVWLVASTAAYDKLSQKNRAAVSEAAAYMSGEIDRVFLEYERGQIEEFALDEVTISQDFSTARTLALRLYDGQAAPYNAEQQKLREILAKIA